MPAVSFPLSHREFAHHENLSHLSSIVLALLSESANSDTPSVRASQLCISVTQANRAPLLRRIKVTYAQCLQKK